MGGGGVSGLSPEEKVLCIEARWLQPGHTKGELLGLIRCTIVSPVAKQPLQLLAFNSLLSLVTKGVAPISQGTAQMLQQECWIWAGPGHQHQECLLTEVEQLSCLVDLLDTSPRSRMDVPRASKVPWVYSPISLHMMHPLILGADWAGFNKLLVTHSACAALICDPSSSNADSGEEDTKGVYCVAPPPQVISH